MAGVASGSTACPLRSRAAPVWAVLSAFSLRLIHWLCHRPISSHLQSKAKERKMKRKKKQHIDVYQSITNQIIAAIEAGIGEVKMPWQRSGFNQSRPINISSSRPYQRINILSLWAAAMTGDYQHGLWGTYRQWQEAGAQVRKGEKSSFIVFYKQFENDESDDGEEKSERRLFMARASRVFNIAQVDGYELPDQSEPTENLVTRIASVEEFIGKTGAKIKEGGEQACYNPANDQINMPDQHRFFDTDTGSATEHWFSVLLHELTHNAVTGIMPISA
jgi:antirestriction protein ArdC